jgi:phosphoglycolate phosphatase
MKQRLVLFDIDGTLLLSMGAGRRALIAAMAGEIPDPVGAAGSVRFDGKTDPQIVREMLHAAGDTEADPGRIEAVLDRYVTCLASELGRMGRQTRVLPGVPDLLTRIERDAGAVLGLLTGNIVQGARLKLESAALVPERFVLGAFGSDHADRTALPAIAAQRAAPQFGTPPRGDQLVIIGDTPADVTCGAALGARALAVATGSYSAAELSAAGAYAVFDTLDDVDAVWEAIRA